MKKGMKFKLLVASMLLSIGTFSQELKPTKTHAKLNVIVTNKDGTIGKGDAITFTSKTSGESFSGVTNNEGKFSILVPKADTYTVKYKSFGEDDEYTELEIPDIDKLINFDFEIIYELPKIYTLENVHFDTGKSTLKSSSFKALNNLAEVLKNKPDLRIELSGHTDSDGSEESNQVLSQNRAEAVKNYVVKKSGIDPSRIIAKGYGESKPVATNDTAEGKQKNRRTDVEILD